MKEAELLFDQRINEIILAKDQLSIENEDLIKALRSKEVEIIGLKEQN